MDTNEGRIYQNDRLIKMREHNTLLLKALACVGHQKQQFALDCLSEASFCGQEAVKDNNQFYTKEVYGTYHKYYAAFKKIKYFDGARWCLLQATIHLKKLQLPKKRKNKILANIIKKYEDSKGDIEEVKTKWRDPLILEKI